MKNIFSKYTLPATKFLAKAVIVISVLVTTTYAGTEYFDIDTGWLTQTASMRVLGNFFASGSVGIGTTSTPTEKLEVNGNIKLSGVTPSYRLTNVANPIDNYDATNKIYVDTRVGAAGSNVANAYLSNGSYYSEGGGPYFCKLNLLSGTNQEIIAVNQNQLCDATNNLFCSAGSCSATQTDINNAKASGNFVSARDYRSCGISSGAAYCWGSTKVSQKYTRVNNSGTAQTHCVIRADGTLWCWGYNGYGEARGDGTTSVTYSPFKNPNISGAIDVRVGTYSVCAVLTNGTVKCWGSNSQWDLGDGTNAVRNAPVNVVGISNAVALAGSQGYSFYCVLLADGTVKCWGYNLNGQLGNGNTTAQWTPVTASGVTNAIKITSSGIASTCALLSSGAIRCWGAGASGQLGAGAFGDQSTSVAVTGISNAVDIVAGYNHYCALLSDNTVKCWGANGSGQLGNGNTTSQSTPVTFSGVTNAVKVSAGNANTCVLLADSTIKCAGINSSGQTGNGNTTNPVMTPETVVWITNATDVYMSLSSNASNCAKLADNTLKCWGYGYYSTLGDGIDGFSATNLHTPKTVLNIDNAEEVFSSNYNLCATQTDGMIRCWGNGNSQWAISSSWINGDGNSSSIYYAPFPISNSNSIYYAEVSVSAQDAILPVQVSSIYAATNIATGNSHTCVVETWVVKCWGANSEWQLGNGSQTNSLVPVSVSVNGTGLKIAAGTMHSCAVLSGGTVNCWGSNTYWQLWDATTTRSTIPKSATGITTAVDIATTDYSTCALLSSGTVQCWGLNTNGQLGNGSRSVVYSASPITVTGLTGVTKISGGRAHMCAVRSGGDVWCWGNNSAGQIGNAYSPKDVFTAQAVTGVTGAARVWAGGDHSCVVKTDGTVQCWGLNTSLQLGAPGFARSFSPLVAIGVIGMFDITTGMQNTCVVKSDLSAINCFGGNTQGEAAAWLVTASSPNTVSFSGWNSSSALASQYTVALCETRVMQTGNLWGVNGADNLCTLECGDGFKFARESEIVNFPGWGATRSDYWVDSTGSNNCSDWTNANSNIYGTHLRFGQPSGTQILNGGSYYTASALFQSSSPCNASRPLLCVRGIR